MSAPRIERLWGLGAAAVVLGFAIVAFAGLRAATDPVWQDTAGYLGHSLYHAEHGGWWGFLREAYTGTFPIVERHALYTLLLAPFAQRSPQFFLTAKCVNLVLGMLTLASLMWMARRRYGPWAALLAGAMYAVSASLVVASSHVNCEPLLVLCTLWMWWWLVSGIAVWRWALAGLFGGLAFLTKGSGLLVLGAVGLGLCWHWRWRVVTLRPVWAFAAAALVAMSPLLVRNLLRHGAPLYEGVNAHSMWFENWNDVGDPASIIREDRYGIWTIERDALPTAASYVRRHGGRAVIARLIRGLGREARVAASAASPMFWARKGVGAVWGMSVLCLAGAGWWLADRRELSGRLTAALIGVCAVFFAWYVRVVEDIRFLAPVMPWLLAYAAYALWRMGARLVGAGRARRAAVGLSGVLLAAGVAQPVASGALTAPYPLAATSPAYERLLSWMEREVGEGDTLLIGPTRDFYGLVWTVRAPVQFMPAPNVGTLEEFLGYLAERQVTLLVMHEDNIRGRWGRLAEALAPYWQVGPDGSIAEQAPLPGWRLVYADPGLPQRFLIYSPASTAGSLNAR